MDANSFENVIFVIPQTDNKTWRDTNWIVIIANNRNVKKKWEESMDIKEHLKSYSS